MTVQADELPSSSQPLEQDGSELLQWAKDLYPIHRSITGEGVRETLRYLQGLLPDLKIGEVPSGEEVFGWRVPQEWSIEAAYIEDRGGNRVIDFANHNLHIMGYSEPVDRWLSLDELQPYLYSLPDQPDAIPYVTSYYSRRWGFCLTDQQRQQLSDQHYHVVIKSRHFDGVLNYGELIIPGDEEQEVLFSTYICHPSMANNELSGPVVAAALARWLYSLKERRYTYRILFVPEAIGAISYLSRNHQVMKERTIAGFVLSCVGDEGGYSMIPSRLGGTYADRILKTVLSALDETDHVAYYSFLDRGSDERQYCSPGIDLPVVGFCRSRYGMYPGYHTSLDDFSVVTERGLKGALHTMQSVIGLMEQDYSYRVTTPCEPQLGKYEGLYSSISFLQCDGDRALEPATDEADIAPREWLHLLAYADGNHDLSALSQVTKIHWRRVLKGMLRLYQLGLVNR